MIKIIAIIRRKAGMTHQEFSAYLREVHGEIGSRNKLAMRRYFQNHVFDSAYGDPADVGYVIPVPRDSASELYFEDLESMGVSFMDPYTREVIGPDGDHFADNPTNLSLLTTEIIDLTPVLRQTAVKAMVFLKAGTSVSPERFHPAWEQAHREGLAAVGSRLLGCVRSLPMELPPVISDYFRAEDGVTYDGVVSLWLAEADALAQVRAYQAAVDLAAGPDLLDRSRGFFLLTREIEIFDLAK